MDSLSASIDVAKNAPLAEYPLKGAWENVVLKGLPPGQQVRPEVLRSWLKCREIGLDPYIKVPPPVLSNVELNKLLKENRVLIEVSKSVIDMIAISVRHTDFIITLTDKDGYVLVVHGDKDILEMAKQNYYLPGCLRTIEHAGTNAIGLSLAEGKPIQLTGAEHYKIHHHPWTCSSAPIYDSNRRIIGAITLSGRSIGKHKHTLALVTAAVETIESQLRENDLIEEKQRLNSMLTLIFNSISDGVIAVNNNLIITHLNSTAAKMLGLDDIEVIERSLDEVVQPEDSLIRSLNTRNYFSGIEISFTCPIGHRSYICSVDPTRNASGHTLGAIVTLTEKRQAINIAKKLSGNYAKYYFKDIKGNNPSLLKQIEFAKIAAKTQSRVLIIGESGTGKELFAQGIHNHSNQRNGPFVAISCAAIPRDLIESELFGYRGGAFTGARKEGQIGKFELANNGTLFLDEVDGLPLDLQAKLLRVLQQNEIMKLGDNRTIPINVRVIAASNSDLVNEVEHSNFRGDLYYRLNVVEIVIPPLRDRIEDLVLLIDHVMKREYNKMGIEKIEISPDALEVLTNYHWPGNIRELENCMERALLMSQGNTIRKTHLPERIYTKANNLPEFRVMSLGQGYKEIIKATLDRSGGNISMASRDLQISRSTLYRKIKEFGLS